MESSMFFGTIWSILPPIIAIVLALITKEVYSSLLLGNSAATVTVRAFFRRRALLRATSRALVTFLYFSEGNVLLTSKNCLLKGDCHAQMDIVTAHGTVASLLTAAHAADTNKCNFHRYVPRSQELLIRLVRNSFAKRMSLICCSPLISRSMVMAPS